MATKTKKNKVLTSREFFRSPAAITELVSKGTKITVTRRGKELFEVLPKVSGKQVTLKDFEHMQFSDPSLDRDLSKKIDDIMYGKK